ncbi:MAG: Crp/Fnr family transcriptional regulator [Gammaproteobacteria bacterium]|nr:MAG: Crp/Fnr family transcriptional regulator [Gammaproteobacteria bacterium]
MSRYLTPRTQPTQCAACPVRQNALFQVVPLSYIEDAQSRRTDQYRLAARRVLYEEGSPAEMAFTLFQGWMLLYRSDAEGHRQGLRVALPGDFLGYMPPGSSHIHHAAVAVTDVVVCGFRQEGLHEMMTKHPDLATHITRIQARYMASCQNHMLGLGRKSAEQRIAYLVAELFHRLRYRRLIASDATTMPFPLTQEMVGDMTGLTPVHTNRVMRKLRSEGLLRVERTRLEIPDADALASLGGFVPEEPA